MGQEDALIFFFFFIIPSLSYKARAEYYHNRRNIVSVSDCLEQSCFFTYLRAETSKGTVIFIYLFIF